MLTLILTILTTIFIFVNPLAINYINVKKENHSQTQSLPEFFAIIAVIVFIVLCIFQFIVKMPIGFQTNGKILSKEIIRKEDYNKNRKHNKTSVYYYLKLTYTYEIGGKKYQGESFSKDLENKSHASYCYNSFKDDFIVIRYLPYLTFISYIYIDGVFESVPIL